MWIDDITALPDVTTRAKWAELLHVNQSTLWRAEERDELRGHRSKSGGTSFTKQQILSWLGIELESVE
jgi:hypothetical protein